MSETRWFESKFADLWVMAGTERTGQYVVLAHSQLGRIGFRLLGGSHIRVRIEPENETARALLARFFPVGEWKQPDTSQFRFSQVFGDGEAAITAIEGALKVLQRRGLLSKVLKDFADEPALIRNPNKPATYYWRRKVHKHFATTTSDATYAED